jgi:hypothetical protein
MNVAAIAIGALAVIAALGIAARAFTLHLARPNVDAIQVPNTTPVLLALTNKLPRRHIDVAILRRAKTKPHDVILARPRAVHAEMLARAVQTLQSTRRASGVCLTMTPS